MVAEETGWSEQSLVYSTHELLHTAAAQGERGEKKEEEEGEEEEKGVKGERG